MAAAAQAAPGHGRPGPEPGSQGIAEVDETSVPCRDGGGAETDGAKGVAGRGRGADGWSGCAGLPESPREERVVGGCRAHEVLTRVHRAFYNLKRRAMGVCHGLRRRHVQRCLDDFVFRWNRRRHRRTSLDSLLGIGPGLPPATYHDIVGGRA